MTHFHNYCKRANRAVTAGSGELLVRFTTPLKHREGPLSDGRGSERVSLSLLGRRPIGTPLKDAGEGCTLSGSARKAFPVLWWAAPPLKHWRLNAPYGRGSVGASFTLVALEAMRTQGGRSC